METKDIILELRTKKGLSQDELAEKLYVTRQAVSRWENGDTIPNTETLKALSNLFDVSINTLLGSPRKLICQCCGMPLEDSTTSREINGDFNEEYCKYCYADGNYRYDNIDELIEVCVKHMSNEEFPPEKVRKYMKGLLPQLNHWKKYFQLGENEFCNFKRKLAEEINDNETYFCNQLECEFGGERYFGIVANIDFILVSTYEENGINPELVLYKKR